MGAWGNVSSEVDRHFSFSLLLILEGERRTKMGEEREKGGEREEAEKRDPTL